MNILSEILILIIVPCIVGWFGTAWLYKLTHKVEYKQRPWN